MLIKKFFMLLSISLFMCAYAEDKEFQSPVSFDEECLPSLPVLQEDFKKAVSQLDQVAGILQYLGPVVNSSNSFTSDEKRNIRLWVMDRFNDIKYLRTQASIISEQSLLSFLQNTRVLCLLLLETLEKKFNPLGQFVPLIADHTESGECLTQEQKEHIYKRFRSYLESNNELITILDKKVRDVGLTPLNKIARKIYDFNDRYRITSVLERLPKYLGIGAIGLYLVNYETVKNIPILGRLKRSIGTASFWDDRGEKAINADNGGDKKTWAQFIQSNDYKALKELGAFGMLLYTNDFMKNYYAPIKSYLSDRFNALKGHDVSNVGSFRYPEITLDDPRLIGLESQIEQMRKIVEYITEPEKYDRSACGLEKGILLTGPSRSGKTLLANALCGSLNQKMQEKGLIKKVAFKEVTWSDIIFTPDGIKSLVAEAKPNAPCILYIDELHTLPLQTKEGGGQTLTQFLTLRDALKSTGVGDEVIILASTNRAHELDDALLKPGRFGLQIHFENPTFVDRKQFFTVMCERNAVETGDIAIESIAHQTENCSYGDLDLVFKTARFTAHNDGRQLKQADFEQAIDVEIDRIRFDTLISLTPPARKIVTAHQAGRAFMLMFYEKHLNSRLEKVTIRGKWKKIKEKRFFDTVTKSAHSQKKTSYGKVFVSHISEAVDIGNDPMLLAKIHIAGCIAEKILLGTSTYTYHPKDKLKALTQLESITMKGLPASAYSQEELMEPKVRAKKLLEQCEKEVTTLFTTHKQRLEKLSSALNERTLLRRDEVQKILALPNNSSTLT